MQFTEQEKHSKERNIAIVDGLFCKVDGLFCKVDGPILEVCDAYGHFIRRIVT